jgi:hypothetical protein
MFNLLWDQVKSKLNPSEIDEAIYILGSDRIEENEDLSREIKSLLELFENIPISFQELYTHKHKVEFYLSKLENKAKDLGIEVRDLISLKTAREKYIYEFLSDGGSTRPQTAESSTPLIDTLPVKLNLYYIEDHRQELIKALDIEHKHLKQQAESLQQDLLRQASIPTLKEVSDFTKKLEVNRR